MADELATDPEYVEACRAAAWADRPMGEISRYWRSDERRFRFPDGWPEGMDPRASVQARIDASRPAPRADAGNAPSSVPSPSVQRLREMLR